MNRYLVMLSIGPVQSMIAAARRSRDLWSGSWLLSALSRSCAKSLSDQGATLIFPYVNDESLLAPDSNFSVSNKLQVIIEPHDETKLRMIIDKTKADVKQRFVNEAKSALDQLGHAKDDIRKDLWDKQVLIYEEIQVAWARIDDDKEDGYKQAVTKVASTLAARKATRDFKPAATDPYDSSRMLPKSSLDGAYETVLAKNHNKLKDTTRLRLSLSDSEQLDCLGVVKRLGFDEKAEQFTPFIRIAAHAWIEKLISENIDLSEVKVIYEELIKLKVATRVKGNQGIYKDFAYDAQLLYPYRIDATIQALKQDDGNEAIKQLEKLKKELLPIWQEYGEPFSYGAMLLADGDRMGELIDKAKSLAEHQRVSQELSDFAESVADTMREFNGHCIYAGGDDILGFVPLDRAYDCSKRLSENFEQALTKVSDELGLSKSPTLSVGLAVCHVMTPMSVIRDLAKQSEKFAKGDHITDDLSKRRNALSILLSIRSGADIQVRFQWSDLQGLQAFKQWIAMYVNKEIPSRVAYDVRNIHLKTDRIAMDKPKLRDSIRATELKRMLMQARTVSGDTVDAQTIEKLKRLGIEVGLDKLADELIVARWFASKTQLELGRE